MKYANITPGVFIKRNNRFSADVEINGQYETVHVKNTGRLSELLIPGAKVWLTCPGSEGRKTKYDLVSVEKTFSDGITRIVNIDSQIPNAVAAQWLKTSGLFSSDALIKREVKFANSRFDIYAEDAGRKAFIEVKGVTLERESKALFPDAPTERGIKHLNELRAAINEGYESYVLFVIQMKGVNSFSPNYTTHAEFGKTLTEAAANGVKVIAVDCIITPDGIFADKPVKVNLEEE